MFQHVVDDDLELRLLELRHAGELFELVDANRERLRAWLPWVDGTRSDEDIRVFVSRSLKEFSDNRGLAVGIWFRSEMAGVVGVHGIDWPNRTTSLGYWIGKGFEGRGMMTRSVTALLDYLFGELGLHRVEIRVAPENRRSRAIPERLGFREEGTLRDREWLYDHWVDHVLYACLDTDWRSNPMSGLGLSRDSGSAS